MARHASRTTPNLQDQSPSDADFGSHSSVDISEDNRRHRRGFTIVELLIVVVVIAILAAVTIVSYNGINNRAKASAASSAAQQAAKKVIAYATLNADQYPATLADAGLSDGSATYQYRVDNDASPRTFCVTATSRDASYWVSSTSATPSAGACAGHGANGNGVITNLVTNPSFESSLSGWSSSRISATRAASAARFGASGQRVTVQEVGYFPRAVSNPTVIAGNTYTLVAYLKRSDAGNVACALSFLNSAGAGIDSPIETTFVSSGSWVRVSATATAPATAAKANIYLGAPTGTAVGVVIDIDGAMLTEGNAAYEFSDGNSAGWAWNGVENASTSSGPVL